MIGKFFSWWDDMEHDAPVIVNTTTFAVLGTLAVLLMLPVLHGFITGMITFLLGGEILFFFIALIREIGPEARSFFTETLAGEISKLKNRGK